MTCKIALLHLERAYELDPALRPKTAPPMAMDEAIVERIIDAALRATPAAKPNTRNSSMPRRSTFSSDALFQRDSDDDHAPRTPTSTARGRRARPVSRRHAHDEENRNLDGAYKHLYKAMDHLYDARDGKIEFDEDIFDEHVTNARDCLKAGGEDEGEEKAEDDVGEVSARSTVETTGSGNPGRKSSSGGKIQGGGRVGGASSVQGGADSALTYFDADAMFQRERH
jgi:hypothetical protein